MECPFPNKLSCKSLQGCKESDTNPFGPEVEAQFSHQYKANSKNVDCGEPDSSGPVYPPGFEDFYGVAGPSSQDQMNSGMNASTMCVDSMFEGLEAVQNQGESTCSFSISVEKVPQTLIF